jgi:ATP-dependent Lon protease
MNDDSAGNTVSDELTRLSSKVAQTNLPDKLEEQIIIRLNQLGKLTNSPTFLPEFDRIERYINWVTSIPWGKRTEDQLNLENAKRILDKNHYGLGEIKERVLEYMSVMKIKS